MCTTCCYDEGTLKNIEILLQIIENSYLPGCMAVNGQRYIHYRRRVGPGHMNNLLL